MAQQASIGRIVHYTSYGTPGGEYGKECRAAIVTEVSSADPERAGLLVVNPTGLFLRTLAEGGCVQEEIDDKVEPGPSGRTGGTWHFPERV